MGSNGVGFEDEDDDWGEFEQPEAAKVIQASTASVADDDLKPGKSVLYQTREGDWVLCKLLSIDKTVDPPSYCIQLTGGSTRETEAYRLRPAHTSNATALLHDSNTPVNGTIKPAALNQLPLEDDDFGDFEAANGGADDDTLVDELVVEQPAIEISSQNHKPPPSALPEDLFTEFVEPAAVVEQPANGLHHHHEQEATTIKEDDDFGDFEAADVYIQVVAPSSVEAAIMSKSRDSIVTDTTACMVEETTAAIDTLVIEEKEEEAAPPSVLEPQEQDEEEEEDDGFGDFASVAPAAVILETAAPPVQVAVETKKQSNPIINTLQSHTAPSTSEYAEYSIVWTRLLQAVARELARGQQLWLKTISNDDADIKKSIQEALLEHPKVQVYLSALGAMYVVAQLIGLAASELGLLRFVDELQTAYDDCNSMWSSCATTTMMSLSEAIVVAGKRRLDQEPGMDEMLELVSGMKEKLSLMSSDEFPRILTWCEGLDSITLLPLSLFSVDNRKVMAVQEWVKDRPCLVAIRRVWTQCVSDTELPDLD